MPKAELDSTLLALADRNRRKVIDLLTRQPRRAGEIAAALSLTPPALSRHLRALRRSGLIEERGVEEDEGSGSIGCGRNRLNSFSAG